jgi:hypothetical protein
MPGKEGGIVQKGPSMYKVHRVGAWGGRRVRVREREKGEGVCVGVLRVGEGMVTGEGCVHEKEGE